MYLDVLQWSSLVQQAEELQLQEPTDMFSSWTSIQKTEIQNEMINKIIETLISNNSLLMTVIKARENM